MNFLKVTYFYDLLTFTYFYGVTYFYERKASMLVFLKFQFGKFCKILRKKHGVNFGKVFRANSSYLLVQSLQ